MTNSRQIYQSSSFINKRFLKSSCDAGRVKHLRRGWYALPDADIDLVAAVSCNGSLGCISGCKSYGLWVPPEWQDSLHICLNPGVTRPFRSAAIFHRKRQASQTELCELEECLVDVMRHHDSETALILAESAVNNGYFSFEGMQRLIGTQSPSIQKRMRFLYPGAESGSETRVRLFFQKRRVPFETQFRVCGVGRVDLRLGLSWIVECDSKEFHETAINYHQDRVRDLQTSYLGYRTTRLSYPQIWFDWENTQRFLSSALKTRQHSRPPRPISQVLCP